MKFFRLKKLDYITLDHIDASETDDSVRLSKLIRDMYPNQLYMPPVQRDMKIEPINNQAKTLNDTILLMSSDDYKDRFKAEYLQLKIRYEKLNDLCTRIEAYETAQRDSMPLPECPKHTCS